MKNAVILHGGFSTPESYWYPSIKQFLKHRGYDVWVPQLPHANKPDLINWLPYVLENGTFNDTTILISHSLGSALALSVLEHLQTPIYKAILVAGFSRPRGARNIHEERVLQKHYDWKRIKQNIKDLIFINSDNDPWQCDDTQAMYLWKHLGGTLILRENEGHMGSELFKQSYRRFHLLEKLLELDYSRQVLDGTDNT